MRLVPARGLASFRRDRAPSRNSSEGITVHVDSQQRLSDDVLERTFTLGSIPGMLWTSGSTTTPAPLVLIGHPGGLKAMYPRLVERARHSGLHGYAAATIELPWSGDRPRSPAADEARADVRRALAAGEPVTGDLVDRLVLPLVEAAVPEWQALLDACVELAEIGDGPVGYSGGILALGTRLAAIEPRLGAAVLFAGKLRAADDVRGGETRQDPAAGPAAVGRRRQ